MKSILLPLSLGLALVSHYTIAQDYPSRPLKLIVTFPPGGGADLLARVVAKQLSEKWGQSVTGVVRLTEGFAFDEQALRAHVRGRLAGYKTPKRVVTTTETIRAGNGKADYPTAKSIAQSRYSAPHLASIRSTSGSRPISARRGNSPATWSKPRLRLRKPFDSPPRS